MYEGKFGNREWEQQRGTEEYQYYRTNEYCMLEEINWRSDEDIDEEALNILLRKYYQMWLENSGENLRLPLQNQVEKHDWGNFVQSVVEVVFVFP